MLITGFWLTLFGLISAAWVASAETAVEVRLLTPVSSYSSKAGAEIEALLATPLCASSIRLIPEGTVVRGRVTRVHRVGIGLVYESARLDLEFDEVRFPDGRSYPLKARLVGVDNARERVDRHGAIHGIRATEALSNRAGERLAFAALGHPLLLIPAFTVTSAMFHFPEPEIAYAEGTELYLKVSFPEALAGLETCTLPRPESSADVADLRRLVAGLPAWSYSKRQRQPMDIVGLVYIGSPEELDRAFTAAGWSGARDNSAGATLTAVRAIAEGGPYAGAPMRTLLLDGAEPDFAFQKALNTFAKRHHLRVWKRPEQWRGRTVWASAATRDIAATFSMRPFGFTHQIEDQVDSERDKVVSDLMFTGCVASVLYVPRTTAYRAGQDYRRSMYTDSRVAVVELNSCQSPRRGPVAETVAARPGAVARGVRRVLLMARNRLIRDNIVWRSGDAARLTWITLRNWRQTVVDERRARIAGGLVPPPNLEAEVPAMDDPPPLVQPPTELGVVTVPALPGLGSF